MNAATPPSRTSRLALATLTAVGIAVLGGALWANTRGATGNVLAGLSGTPRPLTPGALQVDDIAADPFNYKGGITLRAVVARAEGTSPRKFVVVDAREAKICKSTNCAKFYLPVSAETAMPVARWDEVDLEGELVQGDRHPYFRVTGLKNHGQFQ